MRPFESGNFNAVLRGYVDSKFKVKSPLLDDGCKFPPMRLYKQF